MLSLWHFPKPFIYQGTSWCVNCLDTRLDISRKSRLPYTLSVVLRPSVILSFWPGKALLQTPEKLWLQGSTGSFTGNYLERLPQQSELRSNDIVLIQEYSQKHNSNYIDQANLCSYGWWLYWRTSNGSRKTKINAKIIITRWECLSYDAR